MKSEQLPDFQVYFKDWESEIKSFRQNDLLRSERFVDFAVDRGITLHASVSVNLPKWQSRGWIRADDTGDEGSLYFHPFRILALHKIIESWRLRFSTGAPPNRESTLKLVERALD